MLIDSYFLRRSQQLLDSPSTLPEHRDPAGAAHWLHESARLGHIDSIFSLAELHARNGAHTDSFELHMTAALKGHKESQYFIGVAHLISHSATSHLPKPKRHELAASWFQSACDRGHVRAQAHFGFMAYHGVGMKQDKGTGIMWMTNAGEAVSIQREIDTKEIRE